MRIGIMTFHDSANYGAVFQTYALQQYINRYFQCEIIDYRCNALSAELKLKKLEHPKNLKEIIRKFVSYRFYSNKVNNFQIFLNTYCNLSKDVYDKSNVANSNNIYDIFITGSDQVFNLNLTKDDYSYYLDFADSKKYIMAYAASSGNYKLTSNNSEAKKLLKRFNHIACREEQLVSELFDYTGISANLVLDPTFLVTKSEWIQIESEISVPNDFILIYLVSPENKYFQFAQKLSKQTKLPIYYINYNYKKYPHVHNLMDVTPNQFLYLLHHCKYLVTNSFHGTALSIIYEKDFYTLIDDSRYRSNERMKNILSKLGLLNRSFPYDSNVQADMVDYGDSKERLDLLIKESKQYIMQIKDFGVNV